MTRRLLRVRSDGRGRNYSVRRGVVESSLRILYRGDWPAKLWGVVPGSCDVDCVSHTLAHLPAGQPPLRIGFVSDLHAGPTTPARLLDAAFSRLSRADLDVLLLGGDYVFLDASEARAKSIACRAARVPAKRKLAVLGNHDLWTHHGILERALSHAGVELLINRSTAASSCHPGVAIVGLDDPWTGALDATAAFHDLEEARLLIVLCHSPDGLAEAARAAAALRHQPPVLYVCGHTHGGHIATPWGPLVVPGTAGKRYPAGLYNTGPVTLYVSRGVGGIEIPVRAYAKPEVAVFELTAATADRRPWC
jgi:predicted MPP superfamily phosphohydrolase